MSGEERFSTANKSTIEAFKNAAKNDNTRKSTEVWVRVWTKWCFEKKVSSVIENYEPSDLNKLLESFYAEVKNQHGDDYEPESLKIMITSLDRHLKDKGYNHSIVRDREFTSSKSVLEGKAKQLRQEGRGKRPNKSRQLTVAEEEELWEKNRFGAGTPETLIQTMWWLLTQHFGLRGRQEHHQMKMSDFRIFKDDKGVEYVEFSEGPTKTRQSGLNAKQRSFQPRMFSTGTERCPVAFFKEYISRRPVNMQHSGPFYLSIKTNRRDDDNVWYKVQPMGVNKINSMMGTIVSSTSLESSDKRFTNHSARKTLVNKMKKANLDRSDIVKVTGHRNLQSLDDYDEADEQEQRRLSWAISKRNDDPNVLAERNNPLPSTSSFIPQLMSSQAQNMVNSFHNCSVTFNLQNTCQSPVQIQPKKRRYAFIDSDSE